MNHETARSLFMDYLYEEIEETDRNQLEAYIRQHPELQEELTALQSTHQLLQKMPEPEPQRLLHIVDPQKESTRQWWKRGSNIFSGFGWKKMGMAVAAGLILMLFVGSAAKLHFEFSDAGFSVSMGYEPILQQGLDAEQAAEMLNRLQERNTALMARYAETMHQENQKQLQQVVRYVQQQRSKDLQLIEQNLDQLYQANNSRWMQTNEFLGEFLQNTRYESQN